MPETEFTAHGADAKLACVRRGAGAPILLIPGVAGHQQVWGDAFLDRLAKQLEVITYDHRGIGESSFAAEFTHEDLVADAVAVLDAAGLDDAHVLGFSMGGTVAQRLATDHPDRVRTLTLVGTWPDPEDAFGAGLASFGAAGEAGDLDTAVRILFEANVSRAHASVEEHFPPFREAALALRVPAPVVMSQILATAGHDARAKLADLRVPTLVVHGDEDVIINPEAGRRLAKAIPDARLEMWSGIGHHVAWETGERLAEAVLAHVRAEA